MQGVQAPVLQRPAHAHQDPRVSPPLARSGSRNSPSASAPPGGPHAPRGCCSTVRPRTPRTSATPHRTSATASPTAGRAGSPSRRCSGRRSGRATVTASGRTPPATSHSASVPAAPRRRRPAATAWRTRASRRPRPNSRPPPSTPAAGAASTSAWSAPPRRTPPRSHVTSTPSNSSTKNWSSAGWPRDSSIR